MKSFTDGMKFFQESCTPAVNVSILGHPSVNGERLWPRTHGMGMGEGGKRAESFKATEYSGNISWECRNLKHFLN